MDILRKYIFSFVLFFLISVVSSDSLASITHHKREKNRLEAISTRIENFEVVCGRKLTDEDGLQSIADPSLLKTPCPKNIESWRKSEMKYLKNRWKHKTLYIPGSQSGEISHILIGLGKDGELGGDQKNSDFIFIKTVNGSKYHIGGYNPPEVFDYKQKFYLLLFVFGFFLALQFIKRFRK